MYFTSLAVTGVPSLHLASLLSLISSPMKSVPVYSMLSASHGMNSPLKIPKYIRGSHMKTLPSWCVKPGSAHGLVTPIGDDAATPQPRTTVWFRGTSGSDAGVISFGAEAARLSCAKLAAGAASAVIAIAAARASFSRLM